MRTLILYNTRGMVAPLEILRNRHLEHCDLFVHAGNSMVDYQNEYIDGYLIIQGNDDFETHFLRDYMFEIENQRILIINNIEYRGEKGAKALTKFVNALYDKVTIVICAFADSSVSFKYKNTVYISPGDASLASSNTYVIVEPELDGVRVNTFNIQSGDLKKTEFYENIRLKK